MPVDNNNPDLSTISGSGPANQKDAKAVADAVEKAANVVAGAIDGSDGVKPGNEKYDPLLDPKVKAQRDSLLSSKVQVENDLKIEREAKAKLEAELNTFKEAQDKERQAKMSDAEKVQEQLKKLTESNQGLMQKLADLTVSQQTATFEGSKAKALSESGIPQEFHRFVGAGAKDMAGFQAELDVAKETFKNVIKKSDVPAVIKTTTTGTTAPASNDVVNPPANNQPQGRLIDRLDAETAGKINFDTLPEIIRRNPKLAETLNRSIKGR